MAEQETEEAVEEPKSGKGNLIVMIVVILLAIGGGVMTPLVVAKITAEPPPVEKTEAVPPPDLEEEVEYIPFDEVTVNLDEARFSRYLKINFSLQVAKSQRAEIEAEITAKDAVFKNWLQIHLAEKSTEDLSGTYGRNAVRREMQDYFNKVLFEDGIERIQDVLFNEFHVQ